MDQIGRFVWALAGRSAASNGACQPANELRARPIQPSKPPVGLGRPLANDIIIIITAVAIIQAALLSARKSVRAR